MKFSIYQATRQGGRPSNQDRIAYSYSREALLMVLADGMGGHLHGEVASEITVQFLAEAFQKQAKPLLRDPQTFLKQTFYKAYEAIGRHAREHHFPEIPRTTCIACVVQRDMAYWAHVGDSRLYFFRAGRLLARTVDHSRVQQLHEQGRITEAQMLTHPERNKVYNCIGGTFPPEVALSPKTPVYEGDTLLLCSDGLWNMLSAEEIAAVLTSSPLEQAIPGLLDQAELRAGGGGDNLSAIGMTWGEPFRPDSHSVSTAAMPLGGFTTRIDSSRPDGGEPIVSDEEIERTTREIQQTIRKPPRR